jgi:S-formylglutathione hydrolase
MSNFTTEATIKTFGGQLLKLKHDSTYTKTPMDVNVYLPPQYESTTKKLPVLLYLAGLTCSPANGSEKSFFTAYAAKHGFAIIFPDTSPRGAKIEGEDDNWDFGTGAGFYVDALIEPWKENYNMYSYILKELLPLINEEFNKLDVLGNISITGHSMGGYGAIMFYLRNPGFFKSCSAFAPISNPSIVPWGEKCFSNYLGSNKEEWYKYDPCHLIKNYKGNLNNNNNNDEKILIHVGTKDVFNYRDHQLRCENLVEAAKGTILEDKIDLNVVEDYDHSYFFISSFAGEHADFHAKYFEK